MTPSCWWRWTAPNKRSYRRLEAMRSLFIGFERAQVAALFGRSERMVRLWILGFTRAASTRWRESHGLPASARSSGAAARFAVPMLEAPSKAAQEHWTGVKVHGRLKARMRRWQRWKFGLRRVK